MMMPQSPWLPQTQLHAPVRNLVTDVGSIASGSAASVLRTSKYDDVDHWNSLMRTKAVVVVVICW